MVIKETFFIMALLIYVKNLKETLLEVAPPA
jgi:hypothetical protein